ncbi:TPA: hypothetical protein HA361_06340 [Candidatus Woesearchaeota archaeon]|nr:hypothetical protein [Candidatus Woesearchaeota archaeon]HII69372.1 hypothetical protein [Candidatus Woesearchaeota archaeon]
MAEVLVKCGIKREPGYLYFVDKKGNAARVPMARAGQKSSKKQEALVKAGVKRETGYLYFIDKKGNIARAKMARGGKKSGAKKGGK